MAYEKLNRYMERQKRRKPYELALWYSVGALIGAGVLTILTIPFGALLVLLTSGAVFASTFAILRFDHKEQVKQRDDEVNIYHTPGGGKIRITGSNSVYIDGKRITPRKSILNEKPEDVIDDAINKLNENADMMDDYLIRNGITKPRKSVLDEKPEDVIDMDFLDKKIDNLVKSIDDFDKEFLPHRTKMDATTGIIAPVKSKRALKPKPKKTRKKKEPTKADSLLENPLLDD